MKRTFTVLLITPFLFGFTGTDKAQKLSYVGSAFDLKTNKSIYTEFHEEVEREGKHVETITNYKDATGNIIATRVLDFSKNDEKPDYRLDIKDKGYYEGATVNGNSVRLYHFDKDENKLHEKNLVIPEPFVIDGGFNQFIKNHWTAVMAGKNVVLNFLVPARLDFYKFRIRKTGEFDYQGKKAVVVNFESDNFIIRALIDPIIITYDVQTKRILKYEGISNIPKNAKRNYEAKLIYPTVGP